MRPELCPQVFKVNLTRIMKFLCRDNGGCCGELMKQVMECADRMPSVLLWFAWVISLLLAVKVLLTEEHLRLQVAVYAFISEVAAQFTKDIPIRVTLGVSVTIFLLWLERIMA